MRMAEIRINGQQVIQKVVKAHGNSAIIYLPREWLGRRVSVVLEPEGGNANP